MIGEEPFHCKRTKNLDAAPLEFCESALMADLQEATVGFLKRLDDELLGKRHHL